MKFKKAEMNGATAMVWVVIVLAVVYMFAQYRTPGAITPTGGDGAKVPTTGGIPCPYAPTVSLTSINKHDSSIGGTAGNWKYKLNGGTTTTDADGSFEVREDSSLSILVQDANSSTYYRSLWEPTIECGINSLGYTDSVRFTNFETKCFNEIGDPINGFGYYGGNLTIGTGGSRTVKCELEGVADYGTPYGGVMVAEFNQSTYDEGKMDVQWDGKNLEATTTPKAYSVGVAGATTKSWIVPPFDDVGVHTFYITLQAENTVDPASYFADGVSSAQLSQTNYADGLIIRVYPNNYFEEEDLNPSEFRLRVEDMDNTFTSPGGTTKILANITAIIIPVK